MTKELIIFVEYILIWISDTMNTARTRVQTFFYFSTLMSIYMYNSFHSQISGDFFHMCGRERRNAGNCDDAETER